MIVYLSASYSRREELCVYRDQLVAAGVEVSSRWLDPSLTKGLEPQELAMMDVVDIVNKSDVFVAFTQQPDSGYWTGGRHVEFGIAMITPNGPEIMRVGPAENVFHSAITREYTWPEVFEVLTGQRLPEVANTSVEAGGER